MQVTLRANCWDGVRSKSLAEKMVQQMEVAAPVAERFRDKLIRGARRLNDPKVRAIIGFAVPVMLLLHGIPAFGIAHAMAAPEAVPVLAQATTDKILHAFDPLIHLIQSLAYPIAGVMIAGGCLMIMVQQRDKGMSMLQNAAIGYILVQLSPMILRLLVEVGTGI